jgi:hypothetical protein
VRLSRALRYTRSVLEQLLTKARGLQFIADWLDLRDAKREHRRLRAKYEEQLSEAKKRNASEREFEEIRNVYGIEYQIIWEPIYVRNTKKLLARARKYGVQIPPFPTESLPGDSWELSHVVGDWFLGSEAEERLKREIRDEKRQDDDEFRKWATLALSVAAFILALVSLTMKAKQPDPCPRNYYRSDSGECTFALQKASTSQPQQGTLTMPSMQQKKPSPTRPKP